MRPDLARFGSDTPILGDEPKVQRGIPYAELKNERQMLDVYTPTKGKNFPVVVWVHGGGWKRGDKADGAGASRPRGFRSPGRRHHAKLRGRLPPNVSWPRSHSTRRLTDR